MSKGRRKHSPALKAKVALEVVKANSSSEERTWKKHWSDKVLPNCQPTLEFGVGCGRNFPGLRKTDL